jgi:hypothetical protein
MYLQISVHLQVLALTYAHMRTYTYTITLTRAHTRLHMQIHLTQIFMQAQTTRMALTTTR